MHMLGRAAAVALTVVAAACAAESPPDPVPPGDVRPSTGLATTASADRQALSGRVAYSAVVDEAASDDVFVVDLAGGDPVRLTDGVEREFDPALSPGGTLVAYRSNPRADSDDADIWLVGVDGADRRNLTQAPERANWAPARTSDGRIVFSRRGAAGDLELWSMGADGSEQRRLAEGWCEYPSAAPDATSYACSASVSGSYDIVVVDGRGGRTAVTKTPESEFGAAWSPDGEWIVFSRDLGDRWELVRVRPDGSDERVLAEEGVFATWGPGGHLMWSGVGGLNVAGPDGAAPVVLDLAADFPSWSTSAG